MIERNEADWTIHAHFIGGEARPCKGDRRKMPKSRAVWRHDAQNSTSSSSISPGSCLAASIHSIISGMAMIVLQ